MRELKAGDRVLTADSKGKLIFDEAMPAMRWDAGLG